jgi:hypothetical protein
MRLQRKTPSGARPAGDGGVTAMGFEPWLLTIAVLLIGAAASV